MEDTTDHPAMRIRQQLLDITTHPTALVVTSFGSEQNWSMPFTPTTAVSHATGNPLASVDATQPHGDGYEPMSSPPTLRRREQPVQVDCEEETIPMPKQKRRLARYWPPLR